MEELRFLLWPVDAVVGAVTASPGRWRVEEGYYHADLGVVIDASCAGFNFFLICFLLFAYLLLQRTDRWRALPLALLAAWPLAILANAARILTLLRVGEARFGLAAGVWHEAWGAFVYLFFLTGAGLLVQFYLPRRPPAFPVNNVQV